MNAHQVSDTPSPYRLPHMNASPLAKDTSASIPCCIMHRLCFQPIPHVVYEVCLTEMVTSLPVVAFFGETAAWEW